MNREIDQQQSEKIPQQKPYFVTGGLYRRMGNRLAQLKKRMEEIAVEFQHAAHGDWRENSPKDVIDLEWSRANAELTRLELDRSRSVIVDDLVLDLEEVAPGAKVTIEDKNGEASTWILLSLTDSERSFLSVDSPIGSALLKKKKGEKVVIKSGEREIQYTVTEIVKPDFSSVEYEPEIELPSLLTRQDEGPKDRPIMPVPVQPIIPNPMTSQGEGEFSKARSSQKRLEKPSVENSKRLSSEVKSLSQQERLFQQLIRQLDRFRIPYHLERRVYPIAGGRGIEVTIEFTRNGDELKSILTKETKGGKEGFSFKLYKKVLRRWIEIKD